MAVDPSKVSAYAVYKQLQGIKSYEDVKAAPRHVSVFLQKNKKKAKKSTKPSAKDVMKNGLSKPVDLSNGNGKAVPVQMKSQESQPAKQPKKKILLEKVKEPKSPVPLSNANLDSNDGVQSKKKKKKAGKGTVSTAMKSGPEAKSVNEKGKHKTKEINGVANAKNAVQGGADSIGNPAKKRAVAQMNGNTVTESSDPVPSKKMKAVSTPVTIPEPVENIFNSSDVSGDSFLAGQNLLAWLVSPTPVDEFMKQNWESKPLHVRRQNSGYYKWIHSSTELDSILRNNFIRFGKNIDVTNYIDGQRETLNPEGRATPSVVWSYYQDGCSVRFLNPQTYVDNLRKLNAYLQEYFGTFVGANSYLTPPDSQGFAPHYDDIEAFILQLEGKKRWKVYKPRNDSEVLPRFSSRNFSEENDNLGTPIMDVVLHEGDLLYLPRGYIHQARAVGVHSYHITLSCFQLNSWGDFLKEFLNSAIDEMVTMKSEFRQGLPIDYLSYMGLAQTNGAAKFRDKKALKAKRSSFVNKAKGLISKLAEEASFDSAADRMGIKFMWDSLPPMLTDAEQGVTSAKDGEYMVEGVVYNKSEFDEDIRVRLIRKNCVRLVREEQSLRLYFTTENSLEYHGEDPVFVEVPADSEQLLSVLITSYPRFTKIGDLPMESIETKLQLISDIWERGLLMTEDKLPFVVE